MKLVIFSVLLATVLVVTARPQKDQDVSIIKYENDNIGIGGYNFLYELSDGQGREEHAELKNPGAENESLAVKGSFKFVVDGVTYTITYTADENGYNADVAKSR